MNVKFLFLGINLSLIPNLSLAQCAETDCLKLGYTKLEKCDNGLKCPFGEYWACPCDASYQYTCNGANEQPGTDKCGDKYKSCNCASGYEWKDGKCQTKNAILGQCNGYAKNCKIGDILNNDGTCTTNKEAGKEPIGVVVYIGKDNCGQALALKNLGLYFWAQTYDDISSLSNYDSRISAMTDYNSCENTQKIIQSGNSFSYPAAWAAVTYSPSGAWCLPAAGILNNMIKHMSMINSTLESIGGEKISEKLDIWSSSEYDTTLAWCIQNDGLYTRIKNGYESVRPVINF
ncbi:MAG: hypothetical protein Q4F75_05350 [Pseudomonadota bacterium]|nr:hypothetical protein [Pseudomonadota bacterium]